MEKLLKPKKHGFTLIEMLISILLFSIFLSGIFSIFYLIEKEVKKDSLNAHKKENFEKETKFYIHIFKNSECIITDTSVLKVINFDGDTIYINLKKIELDSIRIIKDTSLLQIFIIRFKKDNIKKEYSIFIPFWMTLNKFQ